MLSEKGVPSVAAPDGHGPTAPRTRRRRRWVVTGVTGAIVAVAVTGWSALGGDGGEGGSAAGTPATRSVPVTRQDLVARQEVDGAIGYAGSYSVVNHRSGTVTVLPDAGAVIEAGQVLYRVDQHPVTLMYGDVPAWRDLQQGVPDGPDVRQLEANLVALGFATDRQLTVDETYTGATAAAVRRWQRSLGVDQTGSVAFGEVAFLPGAVRVASVEATKGGEAGPGTPIIKATSTKRVVQVDLDATKQALVDVGDEVEVRLPSGDTTRGTVAAVGSVARTKGEGESAEEVVAVTVDLDQPEATGTLDQAPVKVGIETDSRQGVLAVPVNALLALREGGYGLRTTDRPERPVIAVETGLFAKGMVEVSGDDLREGMNVEVPAS